MAALTTEFQARYSAQRVRELTLADQAGTTTYSSTKLAQAATDAAALFEDIVQVEIDTDNARHVRVGVLLMESLLLEWGAGTTEEAGKVRSRAEEHAKRLARTAGGRGRVLPRTSSGLTPSDDGPGVQRPYFDRTHLDDIGGNPPGPAPRDETRWP